MEARTEVLCPPNGCVFVEGTRLGTKALRGLLSPVADLPEGTNKYGQGSPDRDLSACTQNVHVVQRLQLSCFEVLGQVGAGGFGQVRSTSNVLVFACLVRCECHRRRSVAIPRQIEL
jgi:hypothetical protein